MGKGKFDGLTSRALRRVRAGHTPEDAWSEALKEVYPAASLEAQLKHSCPKWAFCILCNRGYIRGIGAGCCEAAEGSSSAAYTLQAFDLLVTHPSLAANKAQLKRRVFGEKGAEGYRTPNDEVEVLLALWEAGEIALPAETRQ